MGIKKMNNKQHRKTHAEHMEILSDNKKKKNINKTPRRV